MLVCDTGKAVNGRPDAVVNGRYSFTRRLPMAGTDNHVLNDAWGMGLRRY